MCCRRHRYRSRARRPRGLVQGTRLDSSDPAKTLKFSDEYVADCLKRCNLRRRRLLQRRRRLLL